MKRRLTGLLSLLLLSLLAASLGHLPAWAGGGTPVTQDRAAGKFTAHLSHSTYSSGELITLPWVASGNAADGEYTVRIIRQTQGTVSGQAYTLVFRIASNAVSGTPVVAASGPTSAFTIRVGVSGSALNLHFSPTTASDIYLEAWTNAPLPTGSFSISDAAVAGTTATAQNTITSLIMSGALSGATTIDCSSTLTVTGGSIVMAGSPSGPSASTRYLSGGGTSNLWYANVATGAAHRWAINEVTIANLDASALSSNVPFTMPSPCANPAGTSRWMAAGGTAGAWYYNVPTGSDFNWSINAVNKMSLDSNGHLAMAATSDVMLSDGRGIRENTADGSDNRSLSINGGGDLASDARGSFATFRGNEHAANPGCLNLTAGDVTPGGNITLTTHGIERLKIAYDGAVSGGVIGAASGLCGLDSGGLVAQARLGSGSGGAGNKCLLDNQTWGSLGGTAYSCSLYKTSNQVISAATWTAVTWEAELEDNQGLHSTSSNQSRITVPVAGTYAINLQWGSTSGVADAKLYKNGSAVANYVFRHNGSALNTNDVTVRLAANDYLEWFVYGTAGGTITAQTTTDDGSTAQQIVANCRYLGQ